MTLANVARAAGVSVSTASYALREGKSPCSEKTRQRVRAIAEQLGYRPDPVLKSLVDYRLSARGQGHGGNLAMIGAAPVSSVSAEASGYSAQIFRGTRTRAEELGYDLEYICVAEFEGRAERLAQVMEARGIAGLVVLPPLDHAAYADFPWERFAVVAFARNRRGVDLERVVADHYASARLACRKALEMGYTRVGIMLEQSFNRAVEELFVAGYLVELYGHTKTPGSPPLVEDEINPRTVSKWMRSYQPDAILTQGKFMLPDTREDLGVGKEVGMAALNLGADGSVEGLAGIEPPLTEIGRLAIDRLNRRLRDNRKGASEFDEITMLTGKWKPGASLPERKQLGSKLDA